MSEYLGHTSKAAWNVALWLGNDEPLYRECVRLITKFGKRYGRAAQALMLQLPPKTPDGFRYTHKAVKEALEGLDS